MRYFLLTLGALLALWASTSRADPAFDYHQGPCFFGSPVSGLSGPVTCRQVQATDIPAQSMVLISTQAASGSAIQWTGLGTTYTSYRLECTDLTAVNGGGAGNLEFQFGEGATPTWQTGANYNSIITAANAGGSSQVIVQSSATYIGMDGGINMSKAGVGIGFSGSYTIQNVPALNSGTTRITGTQSWTPNGFSANLATVSGYYSDANPKTALRLVSTGSFTGGRCSLYGLTN